MEIIDVEKVALEIASKHLLKNTSFRELGHTYYASPSTIHRRLTKWLKEDRFELRDKFAGKISAFISAQENELGELLARKTGIWRARVVRVSGVEEAYKYQSSEKPESVDSIAAQKASDELHRCLGEITAGLILNSLHKNMTIGVASGRGVGFTIEKLGEIVKQTPSWISGYESIRLVSLCGGTHVGIRELEHSRDFDADENIFSLSAILKTPRHNVSFMTGPISTDKINSKTVDVNKIPLDMIIIGAGQLNTQHHYFHDHDSLQLKSMSVPIRRLIEMQVQHHGLLGSIAEIVLRLYPAVNSNLSPDILDIIGETNSNILAVSPERIRNAGEIILVAGGRQKLDVLYGLLTGRYPDAPIDKKNLTLITDAWTAENILQMITNMTESQHNLK